ncbi:MAG: aminomethyl-transferring glycine dehydrogenase, partial [Candidatus Eremiobacteraeota bacterium]|nr:aminomethyl-transferring glycine dehydrogenase [Candidatus Eremiobacteraeota bacterium]
ELMTSIVPRNLLAPEPPQLPAALTEMECLSQLRRMADSNQSWRSFLGMGYQAAVLPTVIARNVLENPGWYTQYTPYQAEISQGRLEALLNFQSLVCDLTGLPVANSSLLDEGTACAEAMTMALRSTRKPAKSPVILVDSQLHPQTIEVVRGRAIPLGIEVTESDLDSSAALSPDVFAIMLAYPGTEGQVKDWSSLTAQAQERDLTVIFCSDLLSLLALESPAALGAHICVGSSQRFGLPMGFGGPHAGYMACTENFKRQLPGRIVGISTDRLGHQALRLALQTREQHIRRDRATSNICTAQVLPAVLASMYAVYHGPEGLREIVDRMEQQATRLATAAQAGGHRLVHESFLDTVAVDFQNKSAADSFQSKAAEERFLVRRLNDTRIVIALDERLTVEELSSLCKLLGGNADDGPASHLGVPSKLKRSGEILTHPNFHRYRSETEMLRYMKRLENKDLSLAHSMIPLGSCTMKLNATSEMIPISYPGFADLHPAAPSEHTEGYREMLTDCERMLCEITGFHSMSLQPNAGSQGEYAGLLTIRAYHHSRGDLDRTKILIPVSAHGTNPASAVLAGFETVAVKCDQQGNIDLAHLKEQAEKHRDALGGLMITYPSTHGVFEDTLLSVIEIVHSNGGQVYLDGANFNAMVGWVRPGQLGVDVCHLNLHKTFCIPHGGGGPGMGPIGVAEHLAPFLPGHPWGGVGGDKAVKPVSAAPWGSASIMPIVWAYLRMMGSEGLRQATGLAVLNANYLAHHLKDHYSILYTGANDRVAHECILDLRPVKSKVGVEVEDVAKRLIDYSFHAPTMSWPVAGTLMVEPTESESKAELDRFVEAMVEIKKECDRIEAGEWEREDNPLKGAPHTANELVSDDWSHLYSREVAAFPVSGLRQWKFWPAVARIDNAKGDRNLVCSCEGWHPEID